MGMLETLREKKIVAIARSVPSQTAIRAVEALVKGGVFFVEFTFDQSSERTIEITPQIIRAVSEALGSDACIGAGTVLTVEQVDMAVDAGAAYIVSPDFTPEVVRQTKKRGALSMPGAMSPSEIAAAYRSGADVVKVFPAGTLSAGYIKSVRAPLRHIPLMATGGVSIANAKEFLNAGCVALGIGGNLVDLREIEAGNFAAIEQAAREYVAAVQ